MTRTISVFTGTRADYGLLRPLIRAIEADPRTELALIVSGSHLSPAHGMTVSEVEADGVPIRVRVPIWSGDDSALAAAHDVGHAVGRFAEALAEVSPAIVVVLGDRLEALAMSLAATTLGIPVAHVHGGEITEGAMDDALRHAITKLAHLHFTTTESHRRRVIQLGEDPARVFALGAPVLDALAELRLLDPDALRETYGIDFSVPTVVTTFHPAAYDEPATIEWVRRTLEALGRMPGLQTVFTGTNSDIGSEPIRAAIADFVQAHPSRARFVESFGQLGYLSAVAAAAAVAGNSSSTVLEAPLVGTPSVLLGLRQLGRPIAASVQVPAPTADAIQAALAAAIRPEARPRRGEPTVFGTAGFAGRAVEVLASAELPSPPRKRFWDLDAGPDPSTEVKEHA